MSRLASTPEQKRLWRDVADNNKAPGLARVPVVRRPVEPLRRGVAGDPPLFVQPSLPKGLVAGVRVVAAPGLERATFAGLVTIRSVEGERLELELNPQILTILARARGGPLRVKRGDKAQLYYSSSRDPRDRRQIVALRIEGTQEFILSALETGRRPVTVQVPFLQFVARQVGQVQDGTLGVEVTIGREKRVLTQGRIVEFSVSGTSVGIVSSIASAISEGNPYALRVVAWVSR